MDGFFDEHEHLALDEPMVIECARSAPVREALPACETARFCAVRYAPAANAPRYLLPPQTAPPKAA